MTNDFGAIIGPLILGALHDSTGSYTTPFIVALVVVIISLGTTFTMPANKKLAN
jgi:cyanate permease